MKKLLTVSLLAIMSVSAANAKIASTEYMAKVAGVNELAANGQITELTTTTKTLVPAINEVKGTADSALSKANANAQTLQSMATSETVSGINTRLGTAEGEIDTLQAAIAENGSVTTAIAEAKKAGTDADAAVTALTNGQVATNKSNIEALQTGKLDASTYNTDMANTGKYGSKIKASDDALTGLATNTGVIATYVNAQIEEEMKTTSDGLLAEIDAAKNLAAGAQEAADDAQAAADAAQATADKKVDQTAYDAALGQNGTVTKKITDLETNSATKTELNTAKQELQTAISTAISGTDGNGGLTAEITSLEGRMDTAEGEIDTLQAAIAENGSVTTAIAEAKKAGDDAMDAVEALEDGKVAQNTTNITNLTNTVNDQTNGLATKATKAELGINGTLNVPAECLGTGKECALVIINGVAEWQVVQK